jgi:hypothetical protein
MRQIAEIKAKNDNLSKFHAAVFCRYAAFFPINLASVALMFHMDSTTRGIVGSLRAACSDLVDP